MFWTPPSIPWQILCLWFIWLGTASWNFLVTSSECQRKSLLEDMLCTFQPLAKGDLVDHVLHTLIMYKDCLGIMKEQCKNSRLPHLLMIVVHGETLWSPAPQPMDDDDVHIPYVEGIAEKATRILRRHDIATISPHATLRKLLVHPKDKRDPLSTTGCIYEVSCANCNESYVGETGRWLETRLNEHKKETEKLKKVKEILLAKLENNLKVSSLNLLLQTTRSSITTS